MNSDVGKCMQNVAVDRARIVAPPPVIYLGMLGLGLLLEWLWPTRLLSWSLAVGMGSAIFVCGVIGLAAAIRAIWRAQSPIDPYKATTALVTDGLFRFSRNPIYVSNTLIDCRGTGRVTTSRVRTLRGPRSSIGPLIRPFMRGSRPQSRPYRPTNDRPRA